MVGKWFVAAGAIVLGAGCLAGEGSDDPLLGLETPESDVESVVPEDVATATEDVESTSCEAPTENLGVEPGNVLDLSTKFTNCDGKEVALMDLVCDANAVLIDIGAGWCDPCKEEAKHLEEEIVQVFQDQGVVVISLLTEDANGQPANPGTCKQWAAEYGLTSPVLTDPKKNSKTWIKGDPTTSLPINIILNKDFVIQNYLVGGLKPEDLRSSIEEALE